MEVPEFLNNSLIEKKRLVKFDLSLSQISCILHLCKNLCVGSSRFPQRRRHVNAVSKTNSYYL